MLMTENVNLLNFDPRETYHRMVFRQRLEEFGTPQVRRVLTDMLDYIDELENRPNGDF